MIPSDELNPLILSAFTKETTWLEASTRFPLDEFIETFYAMRKRTEESLEGLTDRQVAFSSPVHSLWSISETVSHLVFTQGFYHNKLLEISTSQLPHVVEAARGFGEGAKQNLTVKNLGVILNTATERIHVTIQGTRDSQDANRSEVSPAFGTCTYRTWILLLLAHELDHIRQMVAMRRLARTSP